jgi:hypothetical protein
MSAKKMRVRARKARDVKRTLGLGEVGVGSDGCEMITLAWEMILGIGKGERIHHI